MGTPIPTDPWSAAIMAGGNVLGTAFQKTPNQSSATQNSAFDASGWNVNVNSQGANQAATGGAKSLGASGLQLNTLLNNPLFVVGALAALYFYMKK